jgi:hypothetical protein
MRGAELFLGGLPGRLSSESFVSPAESGLILEAGDELMSPIGAHTGLRYLISADLFGYKGIRHFEAVRMELTRVHLLLQRGYAGGAHFRYVRQASLEGLNVAVCARDADGISVPGRMGAGRASGSSGERTCFARILHGIRLDIRGKLNSWVYLHDHTPGLRRADFERLDVVGIFGSHRPNLRRL